MAPELLQAFITAAAELDAAVAGVQSAQSVSVFLKRQIEKAHSLKDGDGFDPKTGVITRAVN